MIRYATWDNGLTRLSGMTVTFSRADSAVNDFGEIVLGGWPRFGCHRSPRLQGLPGFSPFRGAPMLLALPIP